MRKEKRSWLVYWQVDNDSSSPIFDHFYANGGSETLMEMCNFNYLEFDCLWKTCCQSLLMQKLTLSQGKKTDVETINLLFVVLCILKAATNWNLIGGVFVKKRPTLLRPFSCMADILSLLLYHQNSQWQIL